MRRSKRPSLDWVYRHDRWSFLQDSATTGISVADEEEVQSGTYATTIGAVTNEDRLAMVLVDSAKNMRDASLASGLSNASGTSLLLGINPAANPDSQLDGPGIHGADIEVYMYTETGDWSANASYYMGMRVIIAEQDPYDGRALVHTNYHMWAGVAGLDTINSNPAEYANGRQNCWEHRHYMDRKTTQPVGASVYRARPRFRRRLAYDEGLFLYLELHPNSVALEFVQVFCRTLVSPPTRR